MASSQAHLAAARHIWRNWSDGTVMRALPPELAPGDLAEGHAIQALLPQVSGRTVRGWKLAATNPAGQAHIGVDAPIPGRLLDGQVLPGGSEVDLGRNRMRVAEAEFGLRLAADLPARTAPYSSEEVQAAVASIHPCIEFPDSRFDPFDQAGAPTLTADCACAQWFVEGPAADASPRDIALEQHSIILRVNDQIAVEGSGADVLGSPWLALQWLANAHAFTGGLSAGQVITTGVCGKPCAVSPGDEVQVDAAGLGTVQAKVRA